MNSDFNNLSDKQNIEKITKNFSEKNRRTFVKILATGLAVLALTPMLDNFVPDIHKPSRLIIKNRKGILVMKKKFIARKIGGLFVKNKKEIFDKN